MPEPSPSSASVVVLTREGELAPYAPFPPPIAVPLGPEGGAGLLGDGVAGPAAIAEIKGRDMLADAYAAMFDAGRALSSR